MRLIDADELLKSIANSGMIRETNECLDVIELLAVKKIIDNAPTVEERPKGKWIEKEDYVGDTYYDCSNCGNSWSTLEGTPWQNGMSFCPNCGADMRGDV